MEQPPTQNQLNEALNKAHQLAPTPETWGMFSYSDAPPLVCASGIGSFHWFATKADLISFIRDYLAWWHPAPSSLEPDEIAAEVQAIVDAESADLEKMVSHLNESMRNMWQIEWTGRFQDLLEGEGEFPEKIRSSFLEGGEAVPEEMMDEFGEYLRGYGF